MPERIAVTVRDRRLLAPAICRLELGRSDGAPFAAAEPGAHLTLHTPAGHARSYSITDTTPDGRLAITVAREAGGRGGSVSAVDDTPVGTELEIDGPVNAFPLVDAASYLLIAGGIGITPIRALFRHLRANSDALVRLLYLTRSPATAAYLPELAAADGVSIHHSGENGRFDLWPLVAAPDDATHVYCCAGRELMDEVRMLTKHWRPSQIHFEDFDGVEALNGGASPFTAVWSPTGREVNVPGDQTLLGALRSAGIDVGSSCESGTCGTCVLDLVEGEAEHRDLVLDPGERERRIMACVSRAANEVITVGPAGTPR